MATLRVLEIFDSIQGEGFWSGTPMTFVRLAGCNAPGLGLGCARWCDTPDSWDPEAGTDMTAGEVVARAHCARVCLTGGEPLLQAEGVLDLLTAAHRAGALVHVETNGTVAPLAGAGFDWVTVSPKPPLYMVAAGWEGMMDELKLVADEDLTAATAERVAASHPGAIVCIQPEYHAFETSSERAVALVMGHPAWRLSLQIHKWLGLR